MDTDKNVAMDHILRYKSDYYKLLGIERSATPEVERRAFKRLSLLVHPDKCPGNTRASEAFQALNVAHQTLSDPQKKAIYDRHGTEGVQRHESGANPAGNPYERHGGMHYRQANPQDIFEEFLFGFQRPQHQQRRPGAQHQQQFQGGEINLNFMMLAPILLFLFLAMFLHSAVQDAGTSPQSQGYRGGSYGNAKSLVHAFSLTPNQEDGLTVKRTTNHPHYREFTVNYWVSRAWNDLANRGQLDIRKTEFEVLKKQRDSLGRRCDSENLKMRSKGRRGEPEVCAEFHQLQARVRG